MLNHAIGPQLEASGLCRFSLWAPRTRSVELVLPEDGRVLPMERDAFGCHHVEIIGAQDGTRYRFRLNRDRERADPCSHFQPEGVFGPSAVVDHSAFRWTDNGFRGIRLAEAVIYELHIGAFTPEGTFEAAAARLGELADLGVTAVEIMPVSQFSGARNWGYDGVFHFAPQNSYGGPQGLKAFVNAAHAHGLGVILDTVYNHFGPEGNFLADFAPYFTDRYKTPWGRALNFDGPGSDGVKNFVIRNALHWCEHYHIDGLRLDAVQMIFDMSGNHVLSQISEAVEDWSQHTGKNICLIAETDQNDARLITPRHGGGHGLHALWSDDLHHGLHALLTGKKNGVFRDYASPEHLARCLEDGFAYTGQFSRHRNRSFGTVPRIKSGRHFVAATQTHDQAGNRPDGARLSALAGYEAARVAAAVLFFSPFTPLLFMGEEYAEDNPFLYFVSHENPALNRAVRRGRRRDLKHYRNIPMPDPADEATFVASRLDWGRRYEPPHAAMLAFYREALLLRRQIPALYGDNLADVTARSFRQKTALAAVRKKHADYAFAVFNFSKKSVRLKFDDLLPAGRWEKCLDSREERWLGPGSSVPEEIVTPAELRLDPVSALWFELSQT